MERGPFPGSIPPGYKNFYIYSGASPHTGKSFHWLLPWVNTEMMTFYLEKFSLEYSSEKVLLIMDQAGWHDSHHLKRPCNVSVEFLPPYSPELNPVEKLWQWLRMHVCAGIASFVLWRRL
ncbi:MAG: transposase [bacterium]